ncbi:glycoside hydrolase family 2 protein [Catenulispora rubra]|uniref:glycoside hydrolase family 2 protein n=2 Tax=Catenulispora rubra TaxID=280293 RepID=UPI001891F519|nr:glycoside hydrolase family 2 TIM barrel-domain containing protein [Catenulispora rubra]
MPVTRRRILQTALTAAAVPATGLSVATSTARAATSTYTPPSPRQSFSLDSDWRFVRTDVAGAQATAFDDSAWTPISVPHTWNALDGQDGGNDYYRGIGWYRRHFTAPTALAGKKLWLQFDGANTVADVWVNGVHLGQHQGGYARFRFDATSALKLGVDNVVAVKVNNAHNADIAPLSADFTFCGGMYRDVSLVVTDPLTIRMLDYASDSVYVRQRSVSTSSATVDVETKYWNNSGSTRHVQVRTVITDAGGAVVADTTSGVRTVAAAGGDEVTQTVTLANPRLWRGRADPYLYTTTVEIHDADSGTVVDAVAVPLGLRSFSLDANAGFSLNGAHLRLHGVNRHQDRLNMGWAVSPADHVQDFDLMDEMGVNALRTAHYQQAQQVYSLADQRGYVIWVEIPLVNAITNSTTFTANAQQQLRELIRQNFNHPSIMFWSIGNEQGSNDTATNTLLDTLAHLAATEDPGRISTYAQAGGGSDTRVTHTQTAGFNVYNGWYGGVITDFGPWADKLHASEPARTIAVSEYGAGASIYQHQDNPPIPVAGSTWHPEEYQALLHEGTWKQIQARPYLWGTFVWNMFDFASDGRHEGDTPGRNDKGMVTYDRAVRKDAFYWYKANWTTTPFVYITSRRFTNRTSATTTVKVYGNVDAATLTLNGVSQGTVTSGDHIYNWPVTLAPGSNIVTVTGTRGGLTYTDSVTWTYTSS